MPRLFGTDGIRGVANVELKPTLAYALGRATAHRLVGKGGQLVVGQDTRRSGDMFVASIASGATSLGADVRIAGTVPTPALAFLAGSGDFAAGIMVSASHNPADDNGLKVLDRQGLKLDDAVEDEIEQLIWRTEELGSVGNAEIGRAVVEPALLERYREHRLGLAASIDAAGLRIVLDCANGSGGVVGPSILEATGATVEVIHNEPDGVNINVGSGATAPASLAETVKARGADVGFALDGDADRLIAVDATGTVVDGDQVLGILALDRLERDLLPGGALVVSVLSNGGLQAAIEAAGGQVIRTPVGDKYILEGMQVSGAGLGGEKSGHVIVLEHTTSGDGIVTALEVLRVMTRAGRPLAELAERIPMLPQQQRAVKARHKDQWEGDPRIQRAIREAEARLGESGRVLVRPSGTEPALRVMIEGRDADLVTELADAIAALAGERLN
ncbi:MAG TPA: phosphoglucosamine mutase [Candidatus Limnocylindrales bacterium]|nr:phosphoglucosamine mutase [Candidatus Limnocylindrales bacterium]